MLWAKVGMGFYVCLIRLSIFQYRSKVNLVVIISRSGAYDEDNRGVEGIGGGISGTDEQKTKSSLTKQPHIIIMNMI